jgi:folate-binding protein YgfZ
MERAMESKTELGALDTDAVRVMPLGKECLAMTGADRLRFLNGVVTANVAAVPVGGGAQALLLTAKAHIVAEMRVFVRPEQLTLVVEAGQGEATAAALARYAVMDDVTIAPLPDFALLALLGPRAVERLATAGVDLSDLEGKPTWSHADGKLWLVRVEQFGAQGFWIGGPSAEVHALDAVLDAAGVPRLTPEAQESARVRALEPAWGHEITDEFFPMEIGLGDAIDYKKGCFLGQEPIVRIRDRGHLNWRLARLVVDEGTTAAPGDRLETDAKPKAGKITSVAQGDDGRAAALAVVHVSVPEGTSVRVVTASGLGQATVR